MSTPANTDTELREIIKTIFGDRPEANDTEIIDFYTKAVTNSVLDRLEAEGPKKWDRDNVSSHPMDKVDVRNLTIDEVRAVIKKFREEL